MRQSKLRWETVDEERFPFSVFTGSIMSEYWDAVLAKEYDPDPEVEYELARSDGSVRKLKMRRSELHRTLSLGEGAL